MADAARKDPKRLATTDERNPTRKAMAANPESTAAAPKVASPPAIPTQETASAAPLSASDSKLSGQAAASTSAARPSAGETAGLGGRFPIADAGALARNVGQAMEQGGCRPRDARPRGGEARLGRKRARRSYRKTGIGAGRTEERGESRTPRQGEGPGSGRRGGRRDFARPTPRRGRALAGNSTRSPSRERTPAPSPR